ncbi:MAG: tryptophan 2,3-dioxygenase family protein [bacterium]
MTPRPPLPPVHYREYLQLERLLDCQRLESAKHGAPVHDELLFIVVHQAYELWFKQILWELDAVLALFRADSVDERDIGRAVSHLTRVKEIQKLLLAQVDVLETMTPLDFLDFRSYLVPASGNESAQFRLIENKLGLPPETRVRMDGMRYTDRLPHADETRIRDAEQETSLLALVDRWLARTPFLAVGEYEFWREYRKAVDTMLADERSIIETNPEFDAADRERRLARFEGTVRHFEALFDREKHDALVAQGHRRFSHPALLAALLINLYRDQPILHLPFRLLTLLMDVDEGFTNWRYRHTLMVLRMIGSKMGTGGSSGTDYLRETADKHKVFTDLFDLSTFLIPRSALPALPPEVTRTMSFQYGGEK